MRKTNKILKFPVWILLFCLAYYFLFIPDVTYLVKENPKTTAMIEARNRQAEKKGKKPKAVMTWVPLSRISKNLKRAVIVAEDSAFYTHNGFDYKEIREAIAVDWKHREFKRGASTITQQLAKNLFLSTSKNPLRKFNEAIITYKLERELSKNRIMELYLNLIEWGDGIYGAQAASRKYFGKPASALSKNEAALMAGMIINPRKYTPYSNSKRLARRQRIILARM